MENNAAPKMVGLQAPQDNRKRISIPVALGGIGVKPSDLFKKN